MPGIGLSPDKMLMGRIFSYHDTHLHRIGTNYEQLPINAPKSPVHSYNKDGAMTYRHAGAQPVYAPNSHGGPQADPAQGAADLVGRGRPRSAATPTSSTPRTTTSASPARSTARSWTTPDRDHLADNIVGHASDGVSADVQQRVIAYWTQVDPQLGARVAAGLGYGNAARAA